MHSTRHLWFALGSAALLGITLGACFNGEQAEGLPCDDSSQCGPQLECVDGYCGGVFACADGSTIEAMLACNGTPDCEDGSDEDGTTCGTDAFFCDDGTTIPIEQACDGTSQCPEQEDETHALCDVYDRCVGPSEPFEFDVGPSGPGVTDPLGLVSGQFVGDSRPDLVLAQRGGSFVRIFDFPPGDPPASYDLVGDNVSSPYFTTGVQQVEVYDFDQDSDTDILVLTEDARMFGYFSDPALGVAPVLAGEPVEIPLQPEIVDLALGKFNDDAWVDMVGVTSMGFVITATGDAALGDAGEVPLIADASLVPLDGTSWTTVELHDLDDDGFDELLISGIDGGPRLWIFTRKDGGLLTDFWQLDETVMLPFPTDEFVLGNLDTVPGSDIAVLGGMDGRLMVLRQGPEDFVPSGMPLELGIDINGLAVADFDCSGTDDLVFNVEIPAGVRVQFTTDMGELEADYALDIASEGRPQGSLVVMKFDEDQSWDVFHTIEQTNADEFRGLVSMPPPMMP